MGCTEATIQYFCLAQQQDVVGLHHSHPWYTLDRLASRDSMILMDLDTPEVASSVQSSGGNILLRKSRTSIDFVRTASAWSQQLQMVCCFGSPSKLGEDWPKYRESNYMHQADQAVNRFPLPLTFLSPPSPAIARTHRGP